MSNTSPAPASLTTASADALAAMTALTAVSPLDGRYAARLKQLQAHFSEYALIRNRVLVEVEWLKALAAEPHFTEVEPFPPEAIAALDGLWRQALVRGCFLLRVTCRNRYCLS